MIKFLKSLLGMKEEQEIEYPYHYAEIVYSSIATDKGVFDDFQKKIRIRIGGGLNNKGKIVDIREYSIQEIRSIKKVYNITVLDRTEEEDEEYVFNEVNALTGELIEKIQA